MRNLPVICSLVLLALAAPLHAAPIPVDCDHVPLQKAIDLALPGETLALRGKCLGPLTIRRGALTLLGTGGAFIDGQKQDALTVTGAANVTLQDLEVRNGNNGVVGNNGAHLTLRNVSAHDNAAIGILLQTGSSAVISGGSSQRNGLNGVDAEGSSAITLTGSFLSAGNAVFGVNINGASSLTLAQAGLSANQNTLGIQIGTSASAFIADQVTTITVKNNATTGLTIVSGAHMVAFGGTITSSGNGVHGVSVDSKAGLDLDAAALLTSTGNTGDGLHIEETSVVTLFNTPAFSGIPGTTTVTVQNNGGNGISVLTGSNLTVIHQAAVIAIQNTGAGVLADNGSGVTLIQSTLSKNAKDLALSFGARADVTTSTVGSVSCDATVLIRGALACPH